MFLTPRTETAAPAHRSTLLPADCAQVLPEELATALLAQPVDTVASHSVRGVGSPSVGMLERLDCSYRRRGEAATATLQLRANAYTDPDAATRHWELNVATEGAGARNSQNVAIGIARAVLLSEPGRSVLMITNARVNLTLSMSDGVVPTLATPDVLLDLARRVLPTLALETTESPVPADTTRSSGPPPTPRPGPDGVVAVRVGTHI